MLDLAKKYAALKKTTILSHRITETGKEIVFVLASGPKLTMTESQLKLAISTIEKQAGIAADETSPAPSALPETAHSAEKKTKKKEK